MAVAALILGLENLVVIRQSENKYHILASAYNAASPR